MDLDLVADNHLLICEPCKCKGHPDCECVSGFQVTGEADLNPLLTNLAVAGGLARAWNLGTQNGALWATGRVVLQRFGPKETP